MRQDPTLHADPGGAEAYAGLAQPPGGSLVHVALAASGCTACHLHRCGTQTVFGEGPANARLMLVGEQPGDQEDREGRPFRGPAGRVLDEALGLAGISRDGVYVTNAVKHFKWEPKGARRLHKKPNRAEMGACRPWLESEISHVRPVLVVALGATALEALVGPELRISEVRGRVLTGSLGFPVLPTHHPSALLRVQTPQGRERMMEELVLDLRQARSLLKEAA